MITETNLGYSDARKAIDAILATAQKEGKLPVIAVADSHGELIALARTDGAQLQSVTIAMNKAWTAARQGKPTRDIGQKLRDPVHGFDIAFYGDRRAVGWGGGLPVKIDAIVVGAVAVSGLSEEMDIQLAQTGIDAILEKKG